MAGPEAGRAKTQSSQSKGKGKQPAIQGRGSNARVARRQDYERELQELDRRIEELQNVASASKSTKFSELPLTGATQSALSQAYFHTMTSIQARSLPYTLTGHDILASARTGSGKTLAFIVPLLERLYRAKWGPNDGLGALVISPTRELAVQIFEVLRKVGHLHSFSAGLVIGGKNLKDEQDRLSRMNILIATPGRLLQHMDQTLSFDVSNLQMLVLDEADRILDLGFSKTLDAIISNLPSGHTPAHSSATRRQTLLFSATQTDSIQALARLSLNNPVYISVRNKDNNVGAITGEEDSSAVATSSTSGFLQYEMPANLEQFYMVVDLDRKIDTLWTFIKSHLACKILVFMSSCKQIRFAYETFRHLRPGISLLHLHGKQKQSKRLDIFQKFSASSHAVLFATDIAARGLDFPSVNWVIQLDCPEDVASYVHRVGRTARYNSKGKALLMLLPSEQAGFEKRLKEKKLLAASTAEGENSMSKPSASAASEKGKIRPIRMNSAKSEHSIQKQIQSLLFRFNELKTLGQRAFISYLRSIYLQKDKSVFNINAMVQDRALLEKYARSLGLAGSPKIKFKGQQQEKAVKEKKNRSRDVSALEGQGVLADKGIKTTFANNDNEDDEDDDLGSEEEEHAPVKAKSRKTAASAWNAQDDDDETSEEEPSDLEEAEESDSSGDEEDVSRARQGKQALSEGTSEDSEEEASTSQVNGKPKGIAVNNLLGGDNEDGDDEGDFLTLATRQRHLDIDASTPAGEDGKFTREDALINHEDLSKRRLKQGITKKGLIALRGQGEKLVFDDEGASHALYELVDDQSLSRADIEAAKRKYLLEEGSRMRDVDITDKEAIKALRKAKKLERKEREREVDGARRGQAASGDAGEGGYMLGSDDDEGEVIPDFDGIDLPSESEDDDEASDSDEEEVPDEQAYQKKRKREADEVSRKDEPAGNDEDEDLEELALQALRKKGRR